MANLNAQHLTQLADSFLAFAQAVGNYRYKKTLSPAENRELSDLQWTLLNYSDDLYSTSAILVMNDIEESLQTINTITKEIYKTYHKLSQIQKVIDVAAAGITLGAAIFSKSPKSIAKAIGSLVETWKS